MEDASFSDSSKPAVKSGKITGPILRIERIAVRKDRMMCHVRVSDLRFRNTTPQIALRAQKLFPHLPDHACVNDWGTRFGAVLDHTDLPHLLEHVVIDLQVQRSETQKTFMGVTRWTDFAQGRACIEMSYCDDLVALRAFRDAVDIINQQVLFGGE